MARALKRILSKKEQPEVLDLGQFSRSAAVFLAQRGARVYVEDFEPPPPSPKRKKPNGDKGSPVLKKPLVIPQPDRKFDLVLAWEHGDFVPPERLKDFGAELARVLAPGGLLLMYAQDNPGAGSDHTDPPACYRLLADDRFVRTATAAPARRRWTHPNRAIERALAPLSVQCIHLQRNRIREFLVRKPEADA
jgi:SAM-dependent methyltransferase